ncbi:EAL domain-containing protein [Kyrpidia sp.]|uniref:bifunctional diguanylate cyclase/phosphodiesterase n=1 Tax=Kyrpidia sp. TaxID=2073077 RepID=UPI00258556E8|nr:EAL domain-containing protein [Kyrpidia sp.]MCL6577691.1 EAL domain-containing protein [Kyrpidia sp.]
MRIDGEPTGGASSALEPLSRPLLIAVVGSMLLGFFAMWHCPDTFHLPDKLPYISVHFLLELSSIAISWMIFSVGWHGVGENGIGSMAFLGSVFLAVGLLDVLHTLTYQGMPDFIGPSAAPVATAYWMAARLIEAVGILIATLLPGRPYRRWVRRGLATGAILSVFLIAWAITTRLDQLPALYIPGQGLTPLKIGLEYGVVVVHIATMVAIARLPGKLDPIDRGGMMVGLVAVALGELFFTRYVQVTDVYNLLGHIYKVLGYGFFYRAIFIQNVHAPFHQLQRSQSELFESREWLFTTLKSIGDAVIATDEGGRVKFMNAVAESLTGWSSAEAVGRPIHEVFDILNEQTRLPVEVPVTKVLQEGVQIGLANHTLLIPRYGSPVPIDDSAAPIRDDHGRIQGVVLVFRDISAKRMSEERDRLASRVLESISQGVVITDPTGRIVSVNPRASEITGYTLPELIGQTPHVFSSGRHDRAFYEKMWKSLTESGFWRGEIWNRRKDGRFYLEEIAISAVKDDSGNTTQFVGIFQDITQRRQMEEQIRYQADHDPLTGLFNRNRFKALLQSAIDEAGNTGHLAVLFLDLDRFKFINDTLGHGVGDRLLQEAAGRLVAIMRPGDVVARLGGDEFIVLVRSSGEEREVAEVAERIAGVFREPFRLDGHELYVTASVGISVYPRDGLGGEILVKNADAAMYQAKESGETYQFYRPEMNAATAKRLNLENRLRRALERHEFTLAYQPQVDFRSGRITGVEALVRWLDPEEGVILPGTFIPLAEETGLILPLGRWVLEQACAQTKRWHEQGFRHLKVAVNLSMVQFHQKDLLEMVQEILQRTRLEPRFLELELTESAVMRNPGTAIRILSELRDAGIQIALDDFGIGHSSLNYLKQLPVDRVKIDRSFIRNMPVDSADVAIVTAIVTLAHHLGLRVLAEGVETDAQRDALRSIGCDEYQGYVFSRPVDPGDLVPLLQKCLHAPRDLP